MRYKGVQYDKRFYITDKDLWLHYCKNVYVYQKNLTAMTVENAVLLPCRSISYHEASGEYFQYEGGICDTDLNFLSGTVRINEENPGYNSIVRSYHVPVEEICSCDDDVIFGGFLMGHFGHFILESMSRFWYFLEYMASGKKVVFTMVFGEHTAWIDDFLTLLGLPKEKMLFVDKPTRFKSMIVPDESMRPWGGVYSAEYLLPYEIIRRNVKVDSPYKRIYLSRRKITGKGFTVFGEEYFEKFFTDHGFVVIEPEEYTLEQQISMIKNADEIACVLGTLSHFAMFCRPGTKFIMLSRVDDDALYPQCLINAASMVDWYLVDVSLNFLLGHRYDGVVMLGITSNWKRFVKEHFGEVIDGDTLRDNPTMVVNYMKAWCKWAVQQEKTLMLDSIDFMALFNRFCVIVLGENIPVEYVNNFFAVSPKAESKKREIEKLRHENEELKRILANIKNM